MLAIKYWSLSCTYMYINGLIDDCSLCTWPIRYESNKKINKLELAGNTCNYLNILVKELQGVTEQKALNKYISL